ncbi:MAG: hypothetical protein PHZ19_09365 [Candidatus Thermoplasmatota archaeon]|nr:hypothetical protein [Candidatus Thermoplasmatota archaeon]
MFHRQLDSFVFGDSDTVKTNTLNFEGLLKNLHIRVPDFTNAVTATVTIEDASGYEVYNSGAKTKNVNYNELADIVVAGLATLKVTLSGAPGGAGGTVIVVSNGMGRGV